MEDESIEAKNTLKQNVFKFKRFPTLLHKSTDLTDTAHLSIFVSGIENNFNVTEKLIELPHMTNITNNHIFKE